MKEKAKRTKKQKRVKKSVVNQIIATALCPLLAMSTTVSILSIRGYDDMLVANVIAFILLVSVIQLILVTMNIAKPLRRMEMYLWQLSEGNLNIEVDPKLEKREDEIGLMFESMNTLSKKLNGTVKEIQDVSHQLITSEEMLGKNVSESNADTEAIAGVVAKMTNATEKQTDNVNNASGHINEIDGMISNILGSVEHLEEASGGMRRDSDESMKIMDELDETNKRTNDAIERINTQVNLTYEASVQINDVLQMIANISKQTGLLALNASIEAARAGEHGAGFSVVAEEIGKLANQSSDSTSEIHDIVGNLSSESGKMLEIMKEVLGDVEKQKEKLVKTQAHFGKVNEGIEDSAKEISEIRERTQICNVEKDKIVKNIEVLKMIQKETVGHMVHMQTSVDQLGQTVESVDKTSKQLNNFAESLDNQLKFFSVQ
ncbi:methyl-accepting chemotaxis protein [Fusibacter paucivorans]|uniref:Methyl-accepting chemotaxis protein n=1 Tax=Fusibacter paucivorans TaxID=76009 RepID=A0ABS5PVW5_9FIRM|nr:methyl-accepting chemotaxis protein [Fusibacter paucivorans]MBS7528347.1 methyl-accepting chemotaxis protein [Fusibacter paucivorans]